ncbi:MAG: hypothetical protein HY663_01480 [Chloroflexi bacterium]|nr:hypothetical protein [Chloroflexota bacterium]
MGIKRITAILLIGLLFALTACASTGAGNTQSSRGNPQLTEEYKMGYRLGYSAGFRDGAQAGFNQGRFPLIPGEYETFGDWFYSSYPQYR